MKKFLSIFVAFVLMVSLACVPFVDSSAAPEGMVIVYMQVPDDWQHPHIWAWDDAGNSAFTSWPGGEAEVDPNNEGWYFIFLPNWASNVIINANDGEVQTDVEINTEGQNLWVIIESADEVEATTEVLTTGEFPEYVPRFTIYAQVPTDWEAPHVWAWEDPSGTNVFDAWPGEEMNPSEEDWYSLRLPTWANAVIINANDGEVQTEDIKEFPMNSDLWIIVADDSSVEVFTENPDLAVPNITVRVHVPEGWSHPNLWAWSHPDGSNAFASWPGQAFVANGDWYETEVPGWVNSIIINANGGEVQTGDMAVEPGRDIWVVVEDANTYTFDYVEIAQTNATETPVYQEEADCECLLYPNPIEMDCNYKF